jgi:hypothetical protein
MATSSANASGCEGIDKPSQAQLRRTARVAGIFFVLTSISIAALTLYHSVLRHHGFIGSGGDTSPLAAAVARV